MAHQVLVVDDEEDFSNLTCDQLTDRGFVVATVNDGYEALERVKKEPPDVILLDVLMPGLDGVELLKRLKSDPVTRGIPVLICSITMKERASIQSLLAMGADGYVPKPCPPDRLAASLKAVLESPRA